MVAFCHPQVQLFDTAGRTGASPGGLSYREDWAILCFI